MSRKLKTDPLIQNFKTCIFDSVGIDINNEDPRSNNKLNQNLIVYCFRITDNFDADEFINDTVKYLISIQHNKQIFFLHLDRNEDNHKYNHEMIKLISERIKMNLEFKNVINIRSLNTQNIDKVQDYI